MIVVFDIVALLKRIVERLLLRLQLQLGDPACTVCRPFDLATAILQLRDDLTSPTTRRIRALLTEVECETVRP